VLSFAWLINTFLNTLNHLYGRNPNIPVKGLVQAVKIVIFLITGLFVLFFTAGAQTDVHRNGFVRLGGRVFADF